MIERWRSFWISRTVRERRMLAIMFAVLGAFALWYGLVQPILRARERAELRLAQAATDAGIINARVQALRAARQQSVPTASQPVAALVSSAAGAVGLPLTRNDPAGPGSALVTIGNAKAPALFRWLDALERQGVVVDQIAVRPNPDGSLAADATLRVRS